MKCIRISLFALLLLPAARPDAAAQRIIYVDADAAGTGEGTSWQAAHTDLQSALQTARFGDEIWVAEGVYKPVLPLNPPIVPDTERDVSFRVRDGVAVYGGFAGTETSRDQRDFVAHVTILSGDLLGDDNTNIDLNEPTRQNNSWRVVVMGDEFAGQVGESTVLDGFTITGGNANPPPLNPANGGGGLYVVGAQAQFSSPVIRNVRFEANTAFFGGGAGCQFSNPTFEDVVFFNNSASVDGGGMSGTICATAFRRVHFESNRAGIGGGVMNNRGASTFLETTFVKNSSEWGGGAYNLEDNSVFVDVFFGDNTATVSGGGMYNDDASTSIMNAFFVVNRTLDAAKRGGGGMGNINVDVLRDSPFLTNVVFYGNSTARDGGAIFNVTSDPVIVNSILWNNSADRFENELYNGGQTPSEPIVAANIIQGGVTAGSIDGGGNLDVDPLFVNPVGQDGILGTLDDNFRLLPGSPAIDAGINQALLFDVMDLDEDGDTGESVPVDADWNERVFSGNGVLFAVDMGAYEYGAPPVHVAIESDLAEIPVAPVLLDAYPNPFAETATFRFAVPTAGRVVLKVFDMLGREIVTMLDNTIPAGTHEARFTAPDLANGLYLFRLEIDGTSVTKKMTLVR